MSQLSDIPPDRPAGRRREGAFPWAAALLIATIAGSAGIIVTVADRTTAWLDGMEDARGSRSSATSATATSAPAAPDTMLAAETSDAPQEPAPGTAPPLSRPSPESAPGWPARKPASYRPTPQAAPSRPASESAATTAAARAGAEQSPRPASPGSPHVEKLVEQVALPDTPSPVPAPVGGDEAPAAGPASASPDSVAATWERALPHLEGDAYRAARLRLAEARYHAWEAEPTAEREASARAALRAYRAVAHEGPERDSVTQWMSRLDEAGYH